MADQKSDIFCPKCAKGGGVTDLGLSPKTRFFYSFPKETSWGPFLRVGVMTYLIHLLLVYEVNRALKKETNTMQKCVMKYFVCWLMCLVRALKCQPQMREVVSVRLLTVLIFSLNFQHFNEKVGLHLCTY